CSMARIPPPAGERSTIGQVSRPRVRVRRREAWFASWSIVGWMKPVNWISATGRKPCAASPTESPAMAFSASGVSSTRSGPKRCRRPSVARNTPPSAATSSPRTRTAPSSAMARASARLTACTRLISDIPTSLPLGGERRAALLHEILRQRLVGEVEARFRALRRRRPLAVHRLAHRGDVVAVHLLALDAGGNCFLRKGLGRGLLGHRDRDRPVVVVDDKDQRQMPDTGHIERLGDIALGGGAVAKGTHGDPF